MQVRYPLPLRLPHFSAASKPPSDFLPSPQQPGDRVSFSGQSEPSSAASIIEGRLRKPNPYVQRKGAAGLIHLNDDDSLIPLLHLAFQSKDALVLKYTAEALQKIQNGVAMAELIKETLGHPLQTVRLQAADAIEHIPGEESDALKSPLILQIIRNPDKQIQAYAIPAIKSMQDDDAKISVIQEAFPIVDTTIQIRIVQETLESIQDQAKRASMIKTFLDDPNIVIRNAALRAATTLQEDDLMVPLFSKALKDPNQSIRLLVLEMKLFSVRGNEGRATLIKQALEDSELSVCLEAVRIIRHLLPDETQIPLLKQALKNSSPFVRRSAADCVHELEHHNREEMVTWILDDPQLRTEMWQDFSIYR